MSDCKVLSGFVAVLGAENEKAVEQKFRNVGAGRWMSFPVVGTSGLTTASQRECQFVMHCNFHLAGG